MLSKDERAFTNPPLLRYTTDNLSNVNQREIRNEREFPSDNDSSSTIPLNKAKINRQVEDQFHESVYFSFPIIYA